jgi:mono/diheme cytochrome c family protein
MPGQSPAIILVALMLAAGCAHETAQTTTSATAASPVPPGDVTRGEAVFRRNCTVCHAANGSVGGGVGPPLAGEKKRRNYDQTVAWIKQPDPPMPKLFPYPLSERDVADVAAYVQSL